MRPINCDLGECLTPDPDGIIMPLIDMANIACGGHAGDLASMSKTIQLAKQSQVQVGAHPSYPDRPNFGRISQHYQPAILKASLTTQITEFVTACLQHEMTMIYVKPHGALYHDMMLNHTVFDLLCEVINTVSAGLSLIVQAGVGTEALLQKSERYGIKLIFEAFADRGYRGMEMIPRSEEGAMIVEPEAIIDQYYQLCTQTNFVVDTVCFHSDHAASVSALQQLKGQ